MGSAKFYTMGIAYDKHLKTKFQDGAIYPLYLLAIDEETMITYDIDILNRRIETLLLPFFRFSRVAHSHRLSAERARKHG